MEQNTINDLLKPRYKVIADFPDMESYGIKTGQILKVGKAIRVTGSASFYPDETFCSQYPHLFKKLQWWEERKPEEMPKYIKLTKNCVPRDSIEFYEWRKHSFGSNFLIYNGAMPATEEEYLSFIKTNNQ